MNIAKVYDANVYVNNASKHGLASEITAPTITALMTDYKAMGMIGSAEFFNGFDKLETTIKWTYPDNDAQKAFGNFLKPVDLMIRSSKAEYDNTGITDEKPIVMYIRGYSGRIVQGQGGYRTGIYRGRPVLQAGDRRRGDRRDRRN